MKRENIVRNACCEKWDRRDVIENPEIRDFYVNIRFCPECGTQLRELPKCTYGLTLENHIVACVQNHPDCYKRRLFAQKEK